MIVPGGGISLEASAGSPAGRPSSSPKAFVAFLAPLRKAEWVVYAKEPFGEPKAVLAYLARYTHRVAISNGRLNSADESGVTFRWKDYRIEGPDRRCPGNDQPRLLQ